MFQFIASSENRENAVLVCKGWRDISYTMSDWRRLSSPGLERGFSHIETIPVPIQGSNGGRVWGYGKDLGLKRGGGGQEEGVINRVVNGISTNWRV